MQSYHYPIRSTEDIFHSRICYCLETVVLCMTTTYADELMIRSIHWPKGVCHDETDISGGHHISCAKGFKQENYSTVRGDGGCRVSEVRAGTASPMPDYKGFN